MVYETQSLFTETDSYSFKNSMRDPAASFGKDLSANPYQNLKTYERNRIDSRNDSSKGHHEVHSSVTLSHGPKIRIVPSQAENPMQSIKHDEYQHAH